MGSDILFWRILRLLNMNKFFRSHLRTLKYVGRFFIRRSIFMEHWHEAVTLEGYNEETHKYIVRKVINKDQVIEVEPEKLFLNAYR